ncbi:FadR/GntR family transcriptional regulator [Naumannella huperziae]
MELGKPAVSGEIARRLITAISVGAYSPGERLPAEREFAQRLGIARDTLRQALREVAALGLVEVRRGRAGGTYVTMLDWATIAPQVAKHTLENELPTMRQLFDFRCLIEGTIARAAAQRRTARDLTKINRLLAEFRASDSMITARTLDRRLHGAITAAARNEHLTDLSARLTARVTLGFGAEPYEQGFFDRALADHVRLVELISAGDADAADRCATEHFRITLETMQAALRRAVRASNTGS